MHRNFVPTWHEVKGDNMKQNEDNKILSKPPKATIKSLGVIGLKKDENIIKMSTGFFLKFYEVSAIDSDKELIHKLLSISYLRYRLTKIYKKSGNSIYLLTVFTKCNDYAEAKKVYDVFEKTQILRLSSCDFCKLFTLINFNFKEEVDKVSPKKIFNPTADWKLLFYQQVEEKDKNIVVSEEKFSSTYISSFYSYSKENEISPFAMPDIDYIIGYNFQRFNESEHDAYMKMLSNEYNQEVSIKDDFINFSIMLNVFSKDEQSLKKIKEAVKLNYFNHGLELLDDYGMQKKAYESICSFGITDFHNNIVIKEDNIDAFI